MKSDMRLQETIIYLMLKRLKRYLFCPPVSYCLSVSIVYPNIGPRPETPLKPTLNSQIYCTFCNFDSYFLFTKMCNNACNSSQIYKIPLQIYEIEILDSFTSKINSRVFSNSFVFFVIKTVSPAVHSKPHLTSPLLSRLAESLAKLRYNGELLNKQSHFSSPTGGAYAGLPLVALFARFLSCLSCFSFSSHK